MYKAFNFILTICGTLLSMDFAFSHSFDSLLPARARNYGKRISTCKCLLGISSRLLMPQREMCRARNKNWMAKLLRITNARTCLLHDLSDGSFIPFSVGLWISLRQLSVHKVRSITVIVWIILIKLRRKTCYDLDQTRQIFTDLLLENCHS